MAEEVKKVATETGKEEAKKVEAKPVTVKPKFVKVIPKVTGKRHIGGTWYSLERDKEIEVTEDAKRSLKEAGAIYL